MAVPGENVRLPSTEVSWLKRDLLLFAVSIGVGTDELNLAFVSFDQEMHVLGRVLSWPRNKTIFSKHFPHTRVFYVSYPIQTTDTVIKACSHLT